MRFKKNNKLRYGQDFTFYKGVPTDVDFEIVSFERTTDNMFLVKLIAPGYGGKPYGNGAIYLRLEDMNEIKNWCIDSKI